MNNLSRALRWFQPDAGGILGVGALLTASLVLNVLKPWPLAWLVDGVLLGTQPWTGWLSFLGGMPAPAQVGVLSGCILVLHLAQAGLFAAQHYLAIRIGLRGLTRVRTALFERLLRLSLRYHQGRPAGDLIHRASWDTYAFQTLFQQGVVTLVTAGLGLLLMVGILSRLNGRLTFLALLIVPPLVFTLQALGRRMSACSREAQQADSRVTSIVQQTLGALPLILSHTREKDESARFAAQATEAERRRLSQHGAEILYGLAVAGIFGAGIAAMTWLGAAEVRSGHLSVGQLLVFLAYLAQLYEPLNQLSHVGGTMASAGAGVGRVLEVLEASDEVREKPDAPPRGPARGEIVLEGVSFGYAAERRVLEEVNLVVAPGETVAIIGASGAGKTTLLHLLTRFQDPGAGVVRLDGVDLRDWRLRDVRAQVGLMMQEPALLPASIAENIAFGRPGATAAEIEAAARAAHADVFIRRLPGGYDTVVGDGNIRLSVGEKQRLSLARAFLKDAPVLLLDEPTSALDAASEKLVLESLERLLPGRATVVVSHQPAVWRLARRVLVLESGRLRERPG